MSMEDSERARSIIAKGIAKGPDEIAELVRRAQRAPRLALDIEANGMFAFRASICTIQLAWHEGPGVAVAVIDAFSADLSPLSLLLGPEGPIKVLHDLAFDARLLDEAGLLLERVRDTSIAARFLGRKATGLASLLASEFEIVIEKRFQQHDWSLRPLSEEQIAYLADDVVHLLALDERLAKEVSERDLDAELEDECAYRLATARRPPRDGRPAYTRIKGAGALDVKGRAVLRRLFDARDQAAEAENVPPHRIVSNDALLELSRRRPSARSAFSSIARGRAAPHVAALLAAIEAGLSDGTIPPEEQVYFEPTRPPREFIAKRRALETRLVAWRKAEATRRCVDEQAILPGHCAQDLLDILAAHSAGDPKLREEIARIPGLGARRFARYGEELAAIAKSTSELCAGELGSSP